MTAVPIDRDPESEAARLVAQVRDSHERVTFTEAGEPVAVLVDALELAGLEDTLELLRNPDEAAAVDEGLADDRAGRVHSVDEVLADIARRRGAG